MAACKDWTAAAALFKTKAAPVLKMRTRDRAGDLCLKTAVCLKKKKTGPS